MTETSAPGTRAIGRALKDRLFKARVLANPTATLKEAGVAVPEGTKIFHLVVSENPSFGSVRLAPSNSVDRSKVRLGGESPSFGPVRARLR